MRKHLSWLKLGHTDRVALQPGIVDALRQLADTSHSGLQVHTAPNGMKIVDTLHKSTPRRFKRILHFRLSSLLMPVRTQDGLATHMEIEGTMINHRFEGIFLKLGSSSVYCGPRLQLQLRLHWCAAPGHQCLAGFGLDDHEVAIIVFSGDFPGPLIEPRPVVKGPDFSGLK
ncbi:hypothetical protein C2W62_26240, partial [Candidatus Entotheonella serta]